MREITEKFWKSKESYPSYGNINRRRLFELNYIIPIIYNCNKMLDLGCGDGSLIKCLRNLTEINEYYAYDLSENLLSNLYGMDNVHTRQYNCYELGRLPEANATIMAGLTIYIHNDEILEKLIGLINSPILLLRDPITLTKYDEYINKHVPHLGGQYSATYRTLNKLSNIIRNHFDIVEMVRIYPDELEHTPTTRQYYFRCSK